MKRRKKIKLSSMLPAVLILSASFALCSFFSNCQAAIGFADGTIGDTAAAGRCYTER